MTNKSQGLSFVLLWAFGNAEIFTSYLETFGQWTNQFVENLLHINRLEILKSNVCSAFSGQFRIKPWSPSPSTQLGFYNICKSSNYAKYDTIRSKNYMFCIYKSSHCLHPPTVIYNVSYFKLQSLNR